MDKILAVYEETITLIARDVDINNRWKPSSILSYTQDIANNHCIHLGCSWKDLMSQFRTCYVLTRLKLEMDEYPKSSDKVIIKSWAKENKRIIFTRYFTFEDTEGKTLGRAVTEWVLMNVDTRELVKPSDCNIKQADTSSIEPPIEMPKKFFMQGNEVKRISRIPSYSDFDYNGHVNNARYLEWISDLFDLDAYKDRSIQTVDIRYINEIRDTKPLILILAKEDKNSFFIEGESSPSDKFFIAFIKWQS